MELPVLKDFNLAGKKVLLRVDINSPIDPKTKEILDDTRIRSHSITLDALTKSRVVILAHQSRPGLGDFTTLERHAKKLEEVNGKEVKYIDDVFGFAAGEEIRNLKNGEILVLENVRFCSEEISPNVVAKPPSEQAKTNFVRKLSSYVDFYVNDAFAISHRPQPSVAAFPQVLPSCAGKVMEREIRVLSSILESKEKPRVFAFGGSKAEDSFKVIKSLLERKIADSILTSGLVATIFLFAEGCDIGEENRQVLANKKLEPLIAEAKELLKKYRGRIQTPVDLAFQKNGSRVEASVQKFPNYKILDIGIETIARYSSIIGDARFAVANGPCGVFETKAFAFGTEELLKSMARSKAFSIIGGGHLSAIARSMNLSKEISYISTGGKATIYFLAGEKLPGIEALKERKK
jgi:phosphoglycerate kinase